MKTGTTDKQNTGKRSVANAAAQKKGLRETGGGFADNRQLAGMQRQLLHVANRPSDALPVQRKLILDGNAVESLNDLNGQHADMHELIEAMIQLPGATITLTARELAEVHRYQTDNTLPRSNPARLAIFKLISHGTWTKSRVLPNLFWNENKRFRKNLGKLGDFLKENPNLGKNLRAAGVGWGLASGDNYLAGMGGGAVKDEKIQIEEWVLGDSLFMHMVVHEAGHATFQRLLLSGEKWTDAANRGAEEPDDKALEKDGKDFYDAWRVIRQKPEYFMLTDMPGESAEAKANDGRGGYLAGQFTEFCAESFMHLALYKKYLLKHVKTIPDEEPDIQEAWKKAIAVLLKNEPLILGAQHPGAAATLRLHRFTAALEQLQKGLAGPDLQVANAETAKSGLLDLRKAWMGLNPEEQEQHRGKALHILDQYIMKIQRRRPAQQHLGSELGFAGL